MDNQGPRSPRPDARDQRDAIAAAAVASSGSASPDIASPAAHGFHDWSTFVEGDLVASRFRIIRFIARGGMGEVYEAQDLELQDRVALKTIRPEIAGSDQALKRFRREVLLARKVTHPNVCRTFDVFRHQVASAGDRRAADRELVVVTMELLSGETLAERLHRLGRLSPVEAFAIARQMAAALDAAHDAGIVHRDFKSSNVMLLAPPPGRQTPRVVVTDFGLAQGSVGADVTLSDTAGRLLGTPAYLAPEQLEGAPATRAVDVYAFGVVLFEMVTGVRPFGGDTPLSTALKRLHEAPPAPRELAPDVPPQWNDVILRCLARDPDGRYPTASDAVHALEDEYAPLTPSWAERIPVPSRVLTARRAAVAVALLLVAALAALYFQQRADSLANRLQRGALSLVASSQGRAYHPALSRDGRMLAYVAADEAGQIDLFVGDPDGEGRLRLTNDPAAEEDPQISPDGTRVVFTRRDPKAPAAEIWSVPAFGGQPVLVMSRAAYPAWSPDGTRVAFVHRPDPSGPAVLATSNPDGSNVTPLERQGGEYLNLRSPDWSPDGKEIVFVRGRGGITGELWIVPVAGGPARQVTSDPAAVFSDDPVFSPGGDAVVHSSNRGGATNIWMVPRDGGTPVRLTTGPGPDEEPSIANDGTLVFSNSRWRTALLAYELSSGSLRTLATHSRFLWAPALSPDGREVAYSQGEIDGTWHIWTMPLDGSAAPRRLTATDGGEVYPRYTPDGQHILFQNWDEPRSIWQVPRAGGAPTRLPIAQVPGDGYADMSPDGRSVVFARAESDGEHVYVAPVGGGAARRLVGPGSVPRWSPDGRWIAFSRDRSHVGGVFVVGADGRGLRRVTQRGGWPVWWPDGRQIGYLTTAANGNQVVEVVPVNGGEPRRLEGLDYADSNYPITISPDAREIVTSNGIHLGDQIWLLRPGN